MRIKSFYGNTVDAAVALARREFGEEAILVESRRAPLEARHLGEYEVVCALVPETETTAASPAAEPGAQEARLAKELAEMRRQLDVMGRTITRSAWSSTRRPLAVPELSDWHARLMAADVDGEIVGQILDTVERRCAEESAGVGAAVMAEIERRTLVSATLAPPAADGPAIVVLAGPPGAGKTATLAKLAVSCGLAERRPVKLLSLDDYRVGGADQLRSYAAILGAGFQALDNTGALSQALAETHGKPLILVDTPGYGRRDMDRAADLARFLATRPAITVHLVLTASMKSADLMAVAERFEVFRPAGLLFTRVDETLCFGTAFSLSVRQGKPISFLGTGQDIPDDLEPATKGRILNLLWPPAPAAQQAA